MPCDRHLRPRRRASTTSRRSTSIFRAARSPWSPACRGRASRRSPSTRSAARRSGATSRRFSSYARQFLGRAGRPAVAVDRRACRRPSPSTSATTVRSPRSTVGTLTGLYDTLRLLFARLGDGARRGLRARAAAVLVQLAGRRLPGLQRARRRGPARPRAARRRPRARRSARARSRITTPTGYLIYSQVTIDVLDQVCRAHGFDVDTPWRDLTDEQRAIVLNGSDRDPDPVRQAPARVAAAVERHHRRSRARRASTRASCR